MHGVGGREEGTFSVSQRNVGFLGREMGGYSMRVEAAVCLSHPSRLGDNKVAGKGRDCSNCWRKAGVKEGWAFAVP